MPKTPLQVETFFLAGRNNSKRCARRNEQTDAPNSSYGNRFNHFKCVIAEEKVLCATCCNNRRSKYVDPIRNTLFRSHTV